MASTVLDVRADLASPPSVGTRRLPPAAVLAAGAVAGVEALALVAAALTGLDGLLTSPVRPSGPVVAAALLALASWVVLCAGGGALLVDGAGRRMYAGVAYAEMALVAALVVLAPATSLADRAPATLPLPALALLALAVPVGKLLLAGAPSALAWVAAGPHAPVRPPQAAPRPVLRAATLAVIGAGLVALALTTPVPAADPPPAAEVAAR